MGATDEAAVNLRQMAANVGLDEEEYLTLLMLFIETSICHLKQLKSDILNRDAKKVYETIHTIRGAAENLGIPEISEIARVIELKARKNILEGAEEGREDLIEKLANLTELSHGYN
ncbi:MAG TPA: Hpt domain-containing protein [Syntrophales bacterium]|nr:Hpt domain-containing protein [Syntrophales bacterium]